MSSSDNPPNKKRRVLGPSQDDVQNHTIDVRGEKPQHVEKDSQPAITNGFDKATFSAFIGEELQDAVVDKLQDAAGGDMERGRRMSTLFFQTTS
jgi:hypothetical protein